MLKCEVIKERKQQLRLTIEDIVDYVQVSRPTVCRWMNGDTKKISDEKLKRLSEILKTSEDHLCGRDKTSLLKPIFGIVKAGYDLYAEENILGYEEVTKQESLQGDYYLRVTGDSMIGSRIYDGDLLYIQACSDVDSGQIAIILINGDEATVKRIIKKDHMLILEATNPAYENRYYSEQEVKEIPIRIIGRVLYNKVTF